MWADSKDQKLSNKICRVINRRLGYTKICGLRIYNSVYDYLRYDLRVPKKLLTDENVQQFRYRWVDHLISEYESKGD